MNEWHETSETAPSFLDGREDCFQRTLHRYIAGHENRRGDPLCQRFDIGQSLVVEIGQGQLGTGSMKMLCGGPGEAVFIGYPHDKTLLS